VMENMFCDRSLPPRMTFDLKGKTRSQTVKADASQVLLDTDLMKHTHGMCVLICVCVLGQLVFEII
jgi:hypothetical protein